MVGESKTQFPHLHQGFFNPNVHKLRRSICVHSPCIDLWSITYWVQNCYLLLPKIGAMLCSFIEIHACSSSQVPWRAEDSSFCSLRPAVPLHHQALPCLVHVSDRHLMRWERIMVGGLITIYQDWTFAMSLWVEDNHCQLLWKQYCVSCLLTAKNCSCI